MKKYKTLSKVIDTKEVSSTICNRCGIEFAQFDSPITNIEINFGYGSKFDMEKWDFDLCDDCIEYIMKSFKIKPDINNNSY